jgi:hypothetical protein
LFRFEAKQWISYAKRKGSEAEQSEKRETKEKSQPKETKLIGKNIYFKAKWRENSLYYGSEKKNIEAKKAKRKIRKRNKAKRKVPKRKEKYGSKTKRKEKFGKRK